MNILARYDWNVRYQNEASVLQNESLHLHQPESETDPDTEDSIRRNIDIVDPLIMIISGSSVEIETDHIFSTHTLCIIVNVKIQCHILVRFIDAIPIRIGYHQLKSIPVSGKACTFSSVSIL